MALDPIFHALNRFVARQVVEVLRDGSRSVSEIHVKLKPVHVTRPTISQCLALLLEARLVSRRRVGRQIYYELRPAGWKELAKYSSRLLALINR